MNSLSSPARWYIQSVMLCGAVIGLYGMLRHPVADTWNLLMMAILACQMSLVKIRFRFGRETCSMSMAFPITFAALLTLGLQEGVAVAICCAISQSVLGTTEQPPLYRTLFSVASMVLTVVLSGTAYALGRGQVPMPITRLSTTAVLTSGLTYWLANTGLVSGAISLTAKRPFLAVWLTNLKWTAVNFGLGGILALWLVPFFHAVWIAIFVLLCPLLYLMYCAYKLVRKTPPAQDSCG